MNFKSDNEAPAHPRIMQALVEANEGFATAYSDDCYSRQLDARLSEVFETECRVLPISTGTAANCVALAEIIPPWGAVMCHARSHIQNDEGGAPEFYTAGAKLMPLAGEHGRLQPEVLAAAIDGAGVHGVHNVKPSVVSITQATECGTVYRPEQIRAIAEVAQERGLPLHMDGARFANALAFLGASPAELTWKAGVDVLSLGLTKNGALNAEALVVFGHPEWLEGMERRRKRGGHLLSKMRYVSAQILAMLDDELWLELARHANARAAELAAAIEASGVASLHWPVEANEVFMKADPARLARLKAAGFEFHIWPGHDDLARLVCSFATEQEQVEGFARALVE
ncbi:threonine aldolase family protein [Wenzhouxiangella marina]|uniref:L-threonine aldolase n=1 Tax=Wenzhouxiangella marina TaxID=1579979 RepID=A0A0K0XTR7_9GAMM|nr:beta-eliminating lyase-related protein [Wenzhouxiangella marina]AKS41016.1 L-threonine aldolase [Wenzhouxiangella marina]MBB6087894.1 threonine aldolase [Wenzhouxiangella marina]